MRYIQKKMYICNAVLQIIKTYKTTKKEYIRRNMEHQLHTKTNTHSRGYTCDWFLFTHISACSYPRLFLSVHSFTAPPKTTTQTTNTTQSITPMTKADIIKKIHARTGIRSNAVRNIVEELLSTIKADMTDGHNIYLRGFGSFVVKHHTEKQVYNINNGSYTIIPPHNVPSFKPGKDMMKHTP